MNEQKLLDLLNRYVKKSEFISATYFKGSQPVEVKHRKPKTIEGFLLFSDFDKFEWEEYKSNPNLEKICSKIELTFEEEAITYAMLSIYNSPFVAKYHNVGDNSNIVFGKLPPLPEITSDYTIFIDEKES